MNCIRSTIKNISSKKKFLQQIINMGIPTVYFIKRNLILVLLFLFTLISCGGGGGGGGGSGGGGGNNQSGNSENVDIQGVKTGIFFDTAVHRLNYRTPTQSGTTNTDGKFNYLEGEEVVFSVGGIDLPSTPAKAIVTPLNLANTSNVTDSTATNIVQFLLSLDSDSNPDNGIEINNLAHSYGGVHSLNFSDPDFDTNPDLISLLENSGSSTTSLVDEKTAQAHLLKSLNDVGGVIPADPDDWAVNLFLELKEYSCLYWEVTYDGITYSSDGSTEVPATPNGCYDSFSSYESNFASLSCDDTFHEESPFKVTIKRHPWCSKVVPDPAGASTPDPYDDFKDIPIADGTAVPYWVWVEEHGVFKWGTEGALTAGQTASFIYDASKHFGDPSLGHGLFTIDGFWMSEETGGIISCDSTKGGCISVTEYKNPEGIKSLPSFAGQDTIKYIKQAGDRELTAVKSWIHYDSVSLEFIDIIWPKITIIPTSKDSFSFITHAGPGSVLDSLELKSPLFSKYVRVDNPDEYSVEHSWTEANKDVPVAFNVNSNGTYNITHTGYGNIYLVNVSNNIVVDLLVGGESDKSIELEAGKHILIPDLSSAFTPFTTVTTIVPNDPLTVEPITTTEFSPGELSSCDFGYIAYCPVGVQCVTGNICYFPSFKGIWKKADGRTYECVSDTGPCNLIAYGDGISSIVSLPNIIGEPMIQGISIVDKSEGKYTADIRVIVYDVSTLEFVDFRWDPTTITFGDANSFGFDGADNTYHRVE